MISEFEFFHGAVLARMLHATQQTMVVIPYSELDNASYVINNSKGVYVKYSTKRMSPWRFSFQKRHYEMILEMKRDLGEVFVVLVCNDDGAVVLTFEEFRQVVTSESDTGQWISAARNRREMYLIKGSDGKLEFKIGKDDFSEKIFGLKSRKPDSAEV
jgi:ADP-dependent phosphofructokinase/glucokinase